MTKQARIVLYEGGNPVKQLKFNTVGTDVTDWFQFHKLIAGEYPWPEMASKAQNRFHIEDTLPKRSFIINHEYNGCSNDLGWMVITGKYCLWDRAPNTILYSKESVCTNWTNKTGIYKVKLVVIPDYRVRSSFGRVGMLRNKNSRKGTLCLSCYR